MSKTKYPVPPNFSLGNASSGTATGTLHLQHFQGSGVISNGNGAYSTGTHISTGTVYNTQPIYREDFLVVLPNNTKPINKHLIGLKEDTVFVTTNEDGQEDPHTYYIKKIMGMNPETQQMETAVTYQKIDFIKKYDTLDINNGTKQSVTEAGVGNEQLILMLKHRLTLLNHKFPCTENENAIKHLDYALAWLDKRTIDRLKRGVAGQHKV